MRANRGNAAPVFATVFLTANLAQAHSATWAFIHNKNRPFPVSPVNYAFVAGKRRSCYQAYSNNSQATIESIFYFCGKIKGMFPIRHKACNFRLFDSILELQSTSGQNPDLSVKCPRCSRDKKAVVLAQFQLKVPKRIAPITSEKIYCANLNCMARLLDCALPYRLTDTPSDITIMCPRCKELSYLKIEGIVGVE